MTKTYFTKTGRPIKPHSKPKRDLTGKTFGRLKVIKYLGRCYNPSGNWDNAWGANCSCGTKDVTVLSSHLTVLGGHTTSCGCLKLEKLTTHGHTSGGSTTPTYATWREMRRRCFDPNKSTFKYYGGRGITVCASWRQFKNFLSDMGERPPNMTLDRVDNNGNYKKSNCRWATQKEQCRNSRRNHIIVFNGRKQPLVAWAEEYGIKATTLECRLRKSKWSVKKALTTPARKKLDK